MQARGQRAQALATPVLGSDVVVVADDTIRGRRLLTSLDRSRLDSSSRACTVDDLLATPPADAPDVAVISCGAVRAGVEALARLREVRGLRVILVVPAASRSEVRAAFAAGADGLVLEQVLESTLAPAVEAVLSDQLVLPRQAREYAAPPTLSTREKQVLGLVVLEFSNRAIAAKLHVAEATVKSHLNASFRKLGVRSRAEATARILDPDDGLGLGILSIAEKDRSLDVIDLV